MECTYPTCNCTVPINLALQHGVSVAIGDIPLPPTICPRMKSAFMAKRPDEILIELGALYKKKNAVYGDNAFRVGEVMAGLFPNGIMLKTAHDHNRFHILMLKIVKLTRYAVNWKKGGHADSLRDDAVYAAMLEWIDANGGKSNATEEG